ncbi:Fatty acid synthase alpha subunit [Colletotrichum higginsianum IMI 349063]|uniref:beta-ketoacyl-[acyl-carrier-protein] synthase I n=1 Tax=Colletotrichum higginsianum (strain IMI 349063) TaxID=759273 RepID=A0A1B7Y0X7_COLHI|nr:Fatty acid synthase alpha subunit [Colletotrichum higginsianum IMI 349063]OBR05645.1 Fatty acid synthase alpha subunit [Colletotrichum higginsianum IMI 349063]
MDATVKRYTQAETQLAQILLTELLAHQFCFPVQWIDTQDAILRDFLTERLVEIGPAEILINMAKKSINAGGFGATDIAAGLRRELLSYAKNADSIYFRHQEAEAETKDIAGHDAKTQVANSTHTTAAVTPNVPVASEAASPSTPPKPVEAVAQEVQQQPVSLFDTPTTSLDILTALVAVALKKPSSEIATDQSIKGLCGGRSTLQNEIIGDLVKEFGSLPDQPEDMPISSLSGILTDLGQGNKLGPGMLGLVSKLASTKMPAGTSTATFRQYLENRWRFQTGLQDRVLVRAIFHQPGTRLASEKDVHSFLDDMAKGVLHDLGVAPSALSPGAAQQENPAAAVAVSSGELDAIRGEQRGRDRAFLQVYAKQQSVDLDSGTIERQKARGIIDSLQGKLDDWSAEHGSFYEQGIAPVFDAKKARRYDSYWNWAVQDLLELFSQAMLSPSLTPQQQEGLDTRINEALVRLPTRATPQLLDVVHYLIRTLNKAPDTPHIALVKQWLQDLRGRCASASGKKPAPFRHTVISTVPILEMDAEGNTAVSLVPRLTRSAGTSTTAATPPNQEQDPSGCEAGSSNSTLSDSSRSESSAPEDVFSGAPTGTQSAVRSPFSSVYREPFVVPAAGEQPSDGSYSDTSGLRWTPELQTKGRNGWYRNDDLTNGYLQWFQRASSEGISLRDKCILLTGAGKGSIGAEIVSLTLAAGARLLVTTSSYSKSTVDFYQDLYRRHGASGSELVVVPFNGASHQDTLRLVGYIYDDESRGGLGWDLDHVIPFAALGEPGRAIDGIDDRSEVAHRVMLTNLVRLLGAVKSSKARRRIETHPTHVLLPLSPNHGIFGADGLYAESKMGLEALVNKWWSQGWRDYLTVCGVVIGWTRGTELMGTNDVLATGIERELGIRTFSAHEMAWHVVGLLDAGVAAFCDLEPLMADLSGELSRFTNLKPALDQIQEDINTASEIKRLVFKERALEREGADADAAVDADAATSKPKVSRKARIHVEAVNLPEYEDIRSLPAELQGMVDLEQVAVIVGFGETGPYGSTRTRWEAECSGTFSIDGCLELAWIMGLVKYHNGPLRGKHYCGWIETETKEPISDVHVKAKYESYILDHTGIRVVERQEHDLASPDHEQTLHEVAVNEALEPIEVSPETADDLKREHGDKVFIDASAGGDGGQVFVTFRPGTILYIPKAARFRHGVGVQMPTGWDPRVYGIPDDVIHQVDPVTLYALVSTVEAFLSAGITDPYELYEHIHVSELGNAVGASLGGLKSLHEMFKRRYLDRQVQKDILAETFVNTTAAWLNMLLCGSSGPIRTPVGACATSLESLDTGYDLILGGKAKAVLVGGTDSLERDIAQEFANMQATIDADRDSAAGRTPGEASRPTTSTRNGFVEGEGCGIQLMTTARLAVDMGLPIRAVIALTHTASDKIGRSVPAPGKGILTIAAEERGRFPSPLLDLKYRRRQLDRRLNQIQERRALDLEWLETRLAASPSSSGSGNGATSGGGRDQLGSPSLGGEDEESTSTPTEAEIAEHYRNQIEEDAQRSIKEAKGRYGNNFWRRETSISPLRGSLAVWGLTIDDLDVASLHGTSTKKNDTNETAVIQSQLEWLGRTKGNVLPCVLQKSLLGHGKGAAGAFALNGCIQMLATGIIPGNRNADNIDAELRDRDLLFFPSRTYKNAADLKAFSVTSFGFGQKGAQVVGVNPRYLFATLSEQEYETYRARVRGRERSATKALQEGIYGGSLVKVKEASVYEDKDLERSLLSR